MSKAQGRENAVGRPTSERQAAVPGPEDDGVTGGESAASTPSNTVTSERSEDGGPAFPTDGFKYDIKDGVDRNGMTLRDYFAAQALAGFLANAESVKVAMYNAQPGQTRCDVFADLSYDCADAMLKRREAK